MMFSLEMIGLMAEIGYVFSLKAPSQVFSRVLNFPLEVSVSKVVFRFKSEAPFH